MAARRKRFRAGIDPATAFRRKLIAETELAILIGLTFPDRAARIPRIEVGKGGFGPRFSAQFWAGALGVDVEELRDLEASLASLHAGAV
jgi:hypothetical protein